MFQVQDPQTYTTNRLREVSNQDLGVQDEYLQRIQIFRMRQDQFDQLSFNVSLLRRGNLQQNAFREMLQRALSVKEAQLLRQSQIIEETSQHNRKKNSERRYLLLKLIVVFYIALYMFFKFFKIQFSSSGQWIEIQHDIEVGEIIGVIIVVTFIYY